MEILNGKSEDIYTDWQREIFGKYKPNKELHLEYIILLHNPITGKQPNKN
jgi:hypothetical protein